mmetsp:Transcript_15782/g.24771  ORF Transcript_15782/g.24771 Transcript_15782/m.24771 type:complete len:169 (-) Transcript_15782:170-676(-)
MGLFTQPAVSLSPFLLPGKFPPAALTLVHASVLASAPGTPYLHNASSAVSLGMHFESNFELHSVVSFWRREFSKESMSSAFADGGVVVEMIAVAAAADMVHFVMVWRISRLCIDNEDDDLVVVLVFDVVGGANAEQFPASATIAMQQLMLLIIIISFPIFESMNASSF